MVITHEDFFLFYFQGVMKIMYGRPLTRLLSFLVKPEKYPKSELEISYEMP